MSVNLTELLGGIPDNGPIPEESEDSIESGQLRARLEELLDDKASRMRSEAIGRFDWEAMGASEDGEDINRMVNDEARAVWEAADNPLEFFVLALNIGANIQQNNPQTMALLNGGTHPGDLSACIGASRRIIAGHAVSKVRFDEQATKVIAGLEAELA